MQRPQITVPRLMILVAIVGVATGGGISAYRRWQLVPMYRSQARIHSLFENTFVLGVQPSEIDEGSELAKLIRDTEAHHSAMRQKYERAASFPWFLIDDDPPAPPF